MANEKRLIDANAMREDWLENGENEYVYDANAVLDSIDAQPTVDAVEVVHGRWIEKQEPITWCEDDVEVFYECSVCETQNYGESPYCPNCGAKMDGGNGNG